MLRVNDFPSMEEQVANLREQIQQLAGQVRALTDRVGPTNPVNSAPIVSGQPAAFVAPRASGPFAASGLVQQSAGEGSVR